jgi:hypothetical protein
MTNTVEVEARNVYGAVKFYPICDIACKLASLAGTTTLTPKALRLIRSMGFEVIIEQQKLEGEFV